MEEEQIINNESKEEVNNEIDNGSDNEKNDDETTDNRAEDDSTINVDATEKGDEIKNADNTGNENFDQQKVCSRGNGEMSIVFEDANYEKDKNEELDYGTSLLQDNIYYEKEIQVQPQLIDSLTEGFTEKFLPSLEKNRKTIAQIKSSQAVLMETVQQENAKFRECSAMEGLDKTMMKARLYQNKLLKIRKDMTFLHEKSAKLKKRALRLQQQKQKEELTRAQQVEIEYEKEKMLTARVAPGSPEPSS